MEERKIYFQNVGTIDLFITLKPEDGRLHIHITDEDDGIAVPVPVGGLKSFDVTEDIAACIHDNSLAFTIYGEYHWIPRVIVSPGARQLPDGPVFAMEAGFDRQ